MLNRGTMPSPQAPQSARLPGLDGLRALALFVVILHHQGVLPFGWEAMQMFFVLSGYLITRLLWQTRDQQLGSYLINFYLRRALRILPLYYGVLIVIACAALLTMKGAVIIPALPYLATYSYNLWYAFTGNESQYISHFWSLCAEEQFYLVWPLFIFFCPLAYLRRALLSLMLLGPVIRLAEVMLVKSLLDTHLPLDFTVYILTPTYLDGFAFGAYIALFPLGGSRKLFFTVAVSLVATTYLVLSNASGVRDASGMGPGYVLIWGYTLVNICSALMIDCLVARKLAPALFDARVLRYIGKISYGIYVFHWPVQTAIEHGLPGSSLIVRLTLQMAITTALAAASFAWWEKPFLVKKELWFPAHGNPPPKAPRKLVSSVA
jgi:peptidoglycan/LPS O-acetylase OafA/YrhL